MSLKPFWDWFAAHAEAIEAELTHQMLNRQGHLPPTLNELNRRVSAMGTIWEIGPDESNDGLFLALDAKRLPKEDQPTTQEYPNAPALTGWRFLASKPPKVWGRQLVWNAQHIDASGWRYKLGRWDDGALIIIWGVEDEGITEQIGWVVLESELGNRLMEAHFVDVEIVQRATWPADDQGNSIDDLKEHLEYLLESSITPT